MQGCRESLSTKRGECTRITVYRLKKSLPSDFIITQHSRIPHPYEVLLVFFRFAFARLDFSAELIPFMLPIDIDAVRHRGIEAYKAIMHDAFPGRFALNVFS